MSNSIPVHYAQLFTDGIQLEQQQLQSRLQSAVRVEPVTNGDRAFFDKMSPAAMTARAGRHTDTVLTDTTHTRRMVVTSTFDKADMVDIRDEVRVLNSPVNAYTQTYAAAANRNKDQIIIDQFFATAASGAAGAGTEAHPASHQIASNSEGMTLAKIVQARQILMESEVDMNETLFMVVKAEQIADILNDGTITSNDYNSVRLLMAGDIDSFMGFQWIHTELLGLTSTDTACCAFARNSMLLGIATDSTADISRRPDKNNGLQVSMTQDIGATRMDEVGVVRIACQEA